MDTDRFRVRPGSRVKLARYDPGDTRPFDGKADAIEPLREGIERLIDLQEKLYAQDRWAVLLIFQAMDAAGKDSVIKHVMSGLNPQATQVFSFKSPSSEDLDHDFLWRTNKSLPERGRIGVFNRSYYEEVLVVRVHPEILARQRLHPSLIKKRIWDERFQDINAMERYLSRNGTMIRKIFLHVSKAEQRKRFLERLDDPAKNWKFSGADLDERAKWKEYRAAYEEMLSKTSTREAPWFIVPADNKWFTRAVVADIIADSLKTLKLHFPKVTPEQHRRLGAARRKLVAPRAKPVTPRQAAKPRKPVK